MFYFPTKQKKNMFVLCCWLLVFEGCRRRLLEGGAHKLGKLDACVAETIPHQRHQNIIVPAGGVAKRVFQPSVKEMSPHLLLAIAVQSICGHSRQVDRHLLKRIVEQ